MRLDEIQHQLRALTILRRALASGRAHHAYLFAGPDGVGKELTARALAARLLCERADDPGADACGACQSCVLFASGNHPDFHFIHRGLHKLHSERSVRASKGLFLMVDVIREFLIDVANKSPTLGRQRVFVIRDAERMNEGAQNALLKTLEEPPASTRLMLVSSSAERLLATIRSRCQVVPFEPLPTAFVLERLKAAGATEGEADVLARLSGGRLGVALQWSAAGLIETLHALDRALAGGDFARPESFAKALLEQANELAARLIECAARAEAEGDDEGRKRSVETDDLRGALKLCFMLIASVVAEAMWLDAGGQARFAEVGLRGPAALAQRRDADELADCVEAATRSEWMLDRNVNPQLVCEQLAVRLDGVGVFG